MHRLLSEVADIHYGKSPALVIDQDGEIPVIGTGGRYATATESLYDIGVVVPRKGSLGNPQLVTTSFWPSDTTYAVVPKPQIDPSWLYFSLLNFDLTRLNEATGVPSISRDWLGKLRIYDPGYARQLKIAQILQTIDQAIEHTTALIDKYQQIKAGLMHDLFTRGIGADGKLRPPREQAPELYKQTPIGWIPTTWSVAPLESVCELLVGYAFKSSWFRQEGTKLLRGENVGHGRADWSDTQFLSDERAETFRNYLLNINDLIIGMDRTFTKSGVKITTLTKDDCPSLLVQRVGKFQFKAADPVFTKWLILSPMYLRQLVNQQKGMDIPHLSRSEILAPLVPVAPKDEQLAIGVLLESFNARLHVEEDSLAKLARAKAGLMHDLLTGKVQVTPNTDTKEAADVQD